MGLIGYIKECGCEPDFQHPDGKGRIVKCVDLGHYAEQCPEPHIPRVIAHALWARATPGKRYGTTDPVVSASMITGCPLGLYYKVHGEYVEKVLDRRYLLRGIFGHEGLYGAIKDHPAWIAEEPMYIDLDVGDREVRLYGTPDGYHRPTKRIEDAKTQKKWSIDLKNKMTDSKLYEDDFVEANLVQLNIYKLLLEEGYYVQYDNMPVDEIVEDAVLLYMDGGFRIRRLPVPLWGDNKHWNKVNSNLSVIQKYENFIKVLKAKVDLLDRVINDDIDPHDIPPKEYANFNPVKNSGVWHLVRKNLEERKAAA